MYVSLLVFEVAFLTLFMGVGLNDMLDWEGYVLRIPEMCHLLIVVA